MKRKIKVSEKFFQKQIETIEPTNVSNAVKKTTKSLYEQLFKSDSLISKLTIADGCVSFGVDLLLDVIVSPRLIRVNYFCDQFELRYKGSSNNIQGAVDFIKKYLEIL